MRTGVRFARSKVRTVPRMSGRLCRSRAPFRIAVLGVFGAASLLSAEGSAAAARSFIVCPSGCPFSTIQPALDAAPIGSRITIAPGIYPGDLVVDNSVGLSGAGADQTIISVGGPVVTVATGVFVSFDGVTITGGLAENGAGVYNSGTLVIRHSAVTDNRTDPYRGAGIYNAASGRLLITDTEISGNTAYGGGGGVYNLGTLTVNDSAVTRNSALDTGGGIENDGTLTLNGTTVSANGGGGILNGGSMTLNGSTVSGNGAFTGGGISNEGTATLNWSRVTFNSAGYGAGGIYNSGSLKLTHSRVIGNTTYEGGGGGIYNYDSGSLELMRSTISDNTTYAGEGGGIYNIGRLRLVDSTIINNHPDDCFGC